MTDPLTTQYAAYNQRRLHYSLLFWACLALHFTGLLVTVLFVKQQSVFTQPALFGLAGIATLLMAFIAWRLHRLEINYETHLRKIEDHWSSNGVEGLQRADITSRMSSRKLVVVVLICTGLGFCCFGLMGFAA